MFVIVGEKWGERGTCSCLLVYHLKRKYRYFTIVGCSSVECFLKREDSSGPSDNAEWDPVRVERSCMADSSDNQKDMWFFLSEKLQDQSTGTVFITTEENRSGRIVVKNGKLVGLVYGKETNIDAVEALLALTVIRYSFSKGLVFPLRNELEPQEVEDVMQHLPARPVGGPEFIPQSVPLQEDVEVVSENPLISSRFYRGQEIKEAQNNTRPLKTGKKNAAKMYRGQLIS